MNCKTFTIGILFCLLAGPTFSQALYELASEYEISKPPGKDLKPLRDETFDRFILNYYSFTLLGTATPATGIKVETANPSITLKGNLLNHKRFIVSLELTGGVTNGLMEVFSKNKVNSLFKATAGANFLLGHNSAWYDKMSQDVVRNLYDNGAKKYYQLRGVSDKAIVLGVLTDEDFLNTPTVSKIKRLWEQSDEFVSLRDSEHELEDDIAPLEKKANRSKKEDDELEELRADLKRVKNRISYIDTEYPVIALAYLNEYGMNAGALTDDGLKSFAYQWTKQKPYPADTALVTKKTKLLKLYEAYTQLSKKAVDSLHKFEFQATDNIWRSRTIRWINVAPTIASTSFMYLSPDQLSLAERQEWLPGVKAGINYLKKYKEPHRFIYVTGGPTFQKVTTLEEMTKYGYKKTSQIKVADPAVPTTQETLTSEETGTAYQGDYATGLGLDLGGEIYAAPFKQPYMPGFYGQLQLRYGKPWINDKKISLALGLLWNVTNGDKESKNVLSIVPYVKWSNLLNEFKDREKTQQLALKDLFFAGVQIGVPVNLGK